VTPSPMLERDGSDHQGIFPEFEMLQKNLFNPNAASSDLPYAFQ